jgi:hypothetical protein
VARRDEPTGTGAAPGCHPHHVARAHGIGRLAKGVVGRRPRARRALPTCHLRWDGRVRYGSREHDDHFLLGYLLPALHLVAGRDGRERYLFESCGPVMDRRAGGAPGVAGATRAKAGAERAAIA